MTRNNQKTKIVRLEERQKGIEKDVRTNTEKIERLTESFDTFMNNHFQSFKTTVTEKLATLDVKMKNNTKLTWFLLSTVLGLYVLIIYMLR